MYLGKIYNALFPIFWKISWSKDVARQGARFGEQLKLGNPELGKQKVESSSSSWESSWNRPKEQNLKKSECSEMTKKPENKLILCAGFFVVSLWSPLNADKKDNGKFLPGRGTELDTKGQFFSGMCQEKPK